MGEFCVGNRIGSCSWLIITKDMEVDLDLLVYSFSFSISLQVIGGREGKIVFEDASKFLGKFGGELGSMIGDDF